jgi:hypothetical protein
LKFLLQDCDRHNSVSRQRKNCEAAVPLASLAHQSAVLLIDYAFDEFIVPDKGSTHCLRVLLPKLCASLYIGEEEGNSAGRQIDHI